MVDLGSLGINWVDASDVSSDGSVVVGYSYARGNYYWWAVYGFRWTQSTGMVNLGTLSGYRFTHALAVSADGAIVVGEANLDAAPYWNYKQAWRWTADTGIVGLGVPTGWDSSVAHGISADGCTIIGLLHSGASDPAADPYRAFRWRADTGFQDLGTLGGDRTYVRFAVNRDGTLIYGASQLANGEWRAFRWTASTGIQDLNTLYAGAIPSGWVLRNAIDCSSDGRYVVGWAQGPGDVVRGFLLDTGVSSNRPPAVPTLIAPAHNARVSSLPTFQLRASDPDGDRVRFEVQVWQGSDVRTFSVPASGYVASGQVASGTPPQPLPAGTWRWKARTWDLRGGVSSWSGERSFVVDTRAALTATPTTLPANNQSTSTLTLTYRYSDGAPIAGRTIRFISSRGSADTFSSSTAVTNAQGRASVTVRSSREGVATFTCRDETAGVDLPASVQVTFTPVSQRRPVIDSVRTSLGVQGPFLEEVSLENTITVRVADWGDGAPGRVEFRLPNGTVRTVTPINNEASITLNMGRDLRYTPTGKWNTVRITAYNADDVASEVRELRFYGIETPPSLKSIFWERNPAGFIDSNGLSIVYKYFIRWPSTGITADDDVPGVAQPSQWGLVIPRVYGEVTLTFGLVTYPDPAITFTGRGSLGADIGQDFGRSPDVAIIRAWSFGWRVGVGGYAEFECGSDRPLRLRVAGIVPRVRTSVATPNLLPIVLGWMGFTGIPAAVAIACDMYGTVSFTLRGEIILFDSDRGLAFRDADIYLSLAGKLTVGLSRVVENWLHLRGTVGVSGTVRIQVPERPENRAYFRTGYLRQVSGIFYIEGTVRLVGSIERTLRGHKAWEYPRFRGGLFASPLGQFFEDSGWRDPDRSYLSSGESYHQLVAGSQFFPQDDNWDVREEQLIQNVFPTAEPALTWKDGNAVIVYVYDDPNLPAHQSTEIRALMQQSDGSWQDVPITQDTALDGQPSVAVDRFGNLVAVWTRMEEVSPEPNPSLRLPKAEIAYSVYNASTGRWSAPVKYTNDTAADISPALVKGADGELYLVWLKSPDNQLPYDPLNPSLPHTDIRVAYWDGSQFAWDDLAVAGADTTEAALAVNSAGTPMVVFSQDADGNPETNDTRLMYTFWDGDAWRTPVPVRGDTQPQSSPTLAIANGDLPVLFFVRSGLPHPQHEGYTQEQLVVTTFTGAGWSEPTAVTQANTLNDLQVTTTPDGKVSAMWVTASEGVADIWTTVYDGATDTYSLPVRLTQDDMTHEQQLSLAWDPEGNPSAVYIKRQLTTEERQVRGEDGNWYPVPVTVPARADLYLLAHRPKPDLTISQLWFDPSNAGGGSRVTMTATVRNLRALGASNVKVRFYDGDPNAGGVPIGTATVSPNPLPGGAEGTAVLEWTIPDDGKARTVYAVADPDDLIVERDETNNVATWVVAQLDLQAVAPVVAEYLPDGRVKVRFGVHNPSPVRAAGDVAYRVRLGGAEGEVLLQGTLAVPTARETSLTEWVWDPSALSAGRYQLYVEIDPDNAIEEEEEGNNSASTEIALLADLLVNPALTYLEPGDNGRVRVHTTVQNNGWAAAEDAVVQVRTALEGGEVLASETVAHLERYEVSSLTLEIDRSRAGSTVWVVVNPEGSIDEVRRDNNSIGLRLVQRTYSISGQVTLEDFSGDVTRVPVEVELRKEGNVVQREMLSLDATGGYTLRDVAPGTYDLAFKASHWLRQVRTVEVVSSDVVGVSVSLVNGDIDGDNEVTLFDFGALVAAFGSMPGDSNWNPDADLDGDEEVTLFDFGILVRNFGQMGDE
jgi:probable HAF family extracellular repeat protein